MLVLSRKQGEQIRIGDRITLTVQRLSGNRVSLGIEAPADCKIMRGELESALNAAGISPICPPKLPAHDAPHGRKSRPGRKVVGRKS